MMSIIFPPLSSQLEASIHKNTQLARDKIYNCLFKSVIQSISIY